MLTTSLPPSPSLWTVVQIAVCKCSSSTRGSKIINNSPLLSLSQSVIYESFITPPPAGYCLILIFLIPLRGRACCTFYRYNTDHHDTERFIVCSRQFNRRCEVRVSLFLIPLHIPSAACRCCIVQSQKLSFGVYSTHACVCAWIPSLIVSLNVCLPSSSTDGEQQTFVLDGIRK